MKFQKVSLISAAAVLASLVSAGAYTQPAPHIPTPVGNYDGHAFYVGGAISGLSGYARNQSYTLGSASVSSTGVTPQTFASSATSIAADYTSTVNSFKFGGEAHLGAYFGVSEGYGLSVEVFGVTRTSFNPVSTISVQDGSSSTTSSITLDSSQSNSTATQPNANLATIGLNTQPQNLGYGVRVMPTVMLGEQFGMYASVGYGSQKWQGTLSNSEFFAVANQYSSSVTNGSNMSGTTGASGQSISTTLNGVNYGLGSMFNIDETVTLYTSVEVQTFNNFAVNAVGATIASTDAPTVTDAAATPTYTSGTTQIVDAGTTATPSTLSFQLNTYSIGIDYAFA